MKVVVAVHLVTVLPALLLGIANILMAKGTRVHKLVGRSWVVLMLVTAFISFFIKSGGVYSWIHLLSVFTVLSILISIVAIRSGNIRRHRGFMVGAFCGSLIAGFFATIVPGRVVYEFMFG